MENLRIYHSALKLVSEIYLLIRNNQKINKDFSINDQLKRAAVSIVTNIAEGYKRSNKQYRNFLLIASGSANEVVALLQIITLIHQIKTDSLQENFKILGKQINAFSYKLKDDN